MEVAVDLGLDDGRAFAASHPVFGLLHREMDRKRIHPIDAPRWNCKALPASREARLASGFIDVGRDCVKVIFDEETERKFPGRCKVHGLKHRADVHGAIAEVRDGDVVGSGLLLRPGIACGKWNSATDDCIGAKRACFKPLQVHRAAAASAVTLCQTENLSHRPLQNSLNLLVD
ncbi:hypothetical protein GALL_470260 [mine drainage metagenome]|uniref:Uncharacterized protein n=1 Tax=mine drainage metagenome TaxID=410659 RepID=A0A1J5PIN1_9ZZZZ